MQITVQFEQAFVTGQFCLTFQNHQVEMIDCADQKVFCNKSPLQNLILTDLFLANSITIFDQPFLSRIICMTGKEKPLHIEGYVLFGTRTLNAEIILQSNPEDV